MGKIKLQAYLVQKCVSSTSIHEYRNIFLYKMNPYFPKGLIHCTSKAELTEIFHQLVHSPHRLWLNQAEVTSFIWISHVVAGAQGFRPSSVAFSSPLTGSSQHPWEINVPGRDLPNYVSTPTLDSFF